MRIPGKHATANSTYGGPLPHIYNWGDRTTRSIFAYTLVTWMGRDGGDWRIGGVPTRFAGKQISSTMGKGVLFPLNLYPWTLCELSRVNKRLWKIKGLRRFIISGRTNITFWILFPLTRFQNWIYRISLLLNGSSLKDRKEKRSNPWRNLANSNPYGVVQSRHQIESRTCTYATGGKLKDEERRWWRGEIVEKSDDRPVIFHRSFSDARNVTDPGLIPWKRETKVSSPAR